MRACPPSLTFLNLTTLALASLASAHALAQSPRPSFSPRPLPSFSPIPAPSPVPTSSPSPTPSTSPTPTVDTSHASSEGRQEGAADGQNEGQERGNADGILIGGQQGLAAGHQRCEQELTRQSYARGFDTGSAQGATEGRAAGHEAGTRDGSVRGDREGTADGRDRANRQALQDATPLGRAAGTQDANQSDAAERGQRDGALRGDRQALERANTVDYERGKTDQRAAAFAEPIQNTDNFSQRQQAKNASGQRLSWLDRIKQIARTTLGVENLKIRGDVDLSDAQVTSKSDEKGITVPAPDFRYLDDSRSWPTAEESAAYRDQYRAGYTDAFRRSYMSTFDLAFRTAYPQADAAGCASAQRQDYSGAYRQGFDEGRSRAYQPAYDSQLRISADAAYRAAFPPASRAAYSESYPAYYNGHFEAARQTAYAERVSQLYNSAFEQARATSFNRVYPGYARAAYARGQQDEADDFKNRPLRLLEASVQETIPNGVFEPGETLRLKLKLRNFSASLIAGRDVRIQIRSADNGVILAESDASLIRDLRSKSVTEVRDAMDFRLTEASVGRNVRLKLVVRNQTTSIAEQDITLKSQFQTQISLVGEISLREGLPSNLRIQVANRSDVTTDPSTRIQLLWDSRLVSVPKPTSVLGALRPGESKIIEFEVIGRTRQTEIQTPIAVQLIDANSRRIGLTDLSRTVPVINDYRVALTEVPTLLRNPGIVRAHYRLTNVSSRFLFKGLQLKIRVLNPNGSEVSDALVVGPNPQFLKPIQREKTMEFVIPILSRGIPQGGILELEVQEDGIPVVIHRAEF